VALALQGPASPELEALETEESLPSEKVGEKPLFIFDVVWTDTILGKLIMQAMQGQLEIHDNVVSTAVQIFKLAAMNNFVQGRRMDVVCAVCLYSACRQSQPCKVMLIDFADRLQVRSRHIPLEAP
jgi:hypothetical protein